MTEKEKKEIKREIVKEFTTAQVREFARPEIVVQTIDDLYVNGKELRITHSHGMEYESGVFENVDNECNISLATDTTKIIVGTGSILTSGLQTTITSSFGLNIPTLAEGTKVIIALESSIANAGANVDVKFIAGTTSAYPTLKKQSLISSDTNIWQEELARGIISSGSLTSIDTSKKRLISKNIGDKITNLQSQINTKIDSDDVYNITTATSKFRGKAKFSDIGFVDKNLSSMSNDEADSYICSLVSSYTGNKTHGFILSDLISDTNYPNLYNYLSKLSKFTTANISYRCEFTASTSTPRYIEISAESGSYLPTRKFEGNNWSSKRLRPYSFYGGETHFTNVYGQDSKGNEVLLNNPDNSFFKIMKTGEALSIPLGSREKLEVIMYASQYYDSTPFSVEVQDKGQVLVLQDIKKTAEMVRASATGNLHEYFSDFPDTQSLNFTCAGMYRGEIHLSVSKISQARTEIIAKVYGGRLNDSKDNDVIGAVYRCTCSNVTDYLQISCVTNEVASGEDPINGYVFINHPTWYRDGEAAIQPKNFSKGLKVGKIENLEVINAEDLRQQQDHLEKIAELNEEEATFEFVRELKKADIDINKLKTILERDE